MRANAKSLEGKIFVKDTVRSRIAKKLKSRSADFYIQTLLGILIFILVLFIGMTLMPVMVGKIRVDYAADEIARYVALSGDTNIPQSSLNKILDTYKIPLSNVQIVADEPEPSGVTLVQLSDGFSVTVNNPVVLNFGGFSYSFSVNVSSIARGRSEVYWQSLDRP